MNIETIVDKEYLDKSFRDIVNAPISALRGVSAKDAKALQQAFGVTTVRELSNLNFVKWASALAHFTKLRLDNSRTVVTPNACCKAFASFALTPRKALMGALTMSRKLLSRYSLSTMVSIFMACPFVSVNGPVLHPAPRGGYAAWKNAQPHYGSVWRPGMCAAVRKDGNNFLLAQTEILPII